MSRSPLAYPLTRGIDSDSGGAADLQTDIMRFMAILSLCLVAIFALVQSIPIAPETPQLPALEMTMPKKVVDTPKPLPPLPATDRGEVDSPPPLALVEKTPPVVENIQLTRPQWTPTYTPTPVTNSTPVPVPDNQPPAEQIPEAKHEPVPMPVQEPASGSLSENPGFTLRFESDIALTRLVAAGQVGFYAIDSNRAQRMAVNESRISFWEASIPNAFHEMEAATVPPAVIDALTRTGAKVTAVSYGVTLPTRLSQQLAQLMSEQSGGSLVIGTDGNLKLEPS